MPGPRVAQNLQIPHPRDWQGGQMPRSSPRGGGGLGAAGIYWCIINNVHEKHNYNNKFSQRARF